MFVACIGVVVKDDLRKKEGKIKLEIETHVTATFFAKTGRYRSAAKNSGKEFLQCLTVYVRNDHVKITKVFFLLDRFQMLTRIGQDVIGYLYAQKEKWFVEEKYKKGQGLVAESHSLFVWQHERVLVDLSGSVSSRHGSTTLSRYAWVQPVHDKSGPKIKKAWSQILKRTSPRHPCRLQTDKGKEFYNIYVQGFFREHNIRHHSTSGDAKAFLAERFHCILKGRIYRYFTLANTLKYMDVLQDLVDGYNESYHFSLGMAPQDVKASNELQVWKKLYPSKPSFPIKLQVREQVRLSQAVRLFKKGYLPQWTKEVFEVSRVTPGAPVTYKVKEL